MFNIDPSHCNSVEQKMLYNIQELLRQINDQKKDTVVPLNGERLAFARNQKRKDVDK